MSSKLYVPVMLAYQPGMVKLLTNVTLPGVVQLLAVGVRAVPGADSNKLVVYFSPRLNWNDPMPEIGAGSTVHPSAVLGPQVCIGRDCTIMPGVVIYGPATIGDRVIIHANTVLGADPFYYKKRPQGYDKMIPCGSVVIEDDVEIGANCTIGHKAMLHGCIIGDGTLIGMGATVLNGARIGKGCLIGACALIPEGKEIPDGSLVMGSPGKVVRQLDETARAKLLASAANYQANARRFRSGLSPA